MDSGQSNGNRQVVVEYKNEILGSGVFWKGSENDIEEIHNLPARYLAEKLLKTNQTQKGGMWEVRFEVPKSIKEIRAERGISNEGRTENRTEIDAGKRGLVASALKRQGIDPKTVKTNDLELNVLSGKSFEDDRK